MGTAAATRLAAGWMVSVVPQGVIAIGPTDEVMVALDDVPGVAPALARALAHGLRSTDAGAPVDVPVDAYDSLLERLEALGAFADGSAPVALASADEVVPDGRSLAAAVLAARAGSPPDGLVWTAEELLAVPVGLPAHLRLRVLRAFVGGLRPDGRLQAYALLSRGAGAVYGDLPAVGTVAARLADRDRDEAAIEVVSLAGPARRWTVAPERLERIGAGEPHRLGPILSRAEPVRIGDAEDAPWLCVAEIAAGNLAAPGTAGDRVVQGVGTPAHARLVACAEGAERYAMSDLSEAELVRAPRSELPGAVDPATLYRGRQATWSGEAAENAGAAGAADAAAPDAAATRAADAATADEPRLWSAVRARDGARRWAPAETVHASIVAPCRAELAIPWTSSGVAAHLDLAQARRRAFWELIERDAFMWTWIQRVSRERVAPETAPADARRLAALAARDGWATSWVNLSLDTLPVILCCMQHEREGLTLGAACDADPAAALGRATREAVVLALHVRFGSERRPRREQMRTPRDHLHRHRDPARVSEHGFLLSSTQELELGDIRGGDGEDVEELLEGLGHPPLTADLTLPAGAPFHVVRALAPGLLPLTFGWQREPLGMPRALSPLVTREGRILGKQIDAAVSGAKVGPHPFP